MDSYATFQVHEGTQEKYDKIVQYAQQRVEIPSSWLGYRSQASHTVVRTVTAIGTVETEQYSRQRVEYGKCAYAGMIVLVVQRGSVWQAIDRKVVTGCTPTKG